MNKNNHKIILAFMLFFSTGLFADGALVPLETKVMPEEISKNDDNQTDNLKLQKSKFNSEKQEEEKKKIKTKKKKK